MANVTHYRVLFYGMPNGNEDSRAQITVYEDQTELGYIMFHDPGMPFRNDTQSEGKITMHLPSAMFESVIDILRNEKPINFEFELDHACLSTSSTEPVGEGERGKIYHWPYLTFDRYTTIDFKDMLQGDIDPKRAFYFGRVLGSDGVFVTGIGLPKFANGSWFELLYTTEEERNEVYETFRLFQDTYSKYGVSDNILQVHAHSFCVHPAQDIRCWRADILTAMEQKAELMREIGMKKMLLDHEYAKPASMQQSEEYWYDLGSEIMETVTSVYPEIEFVLYPSLTQYYQARHSGGSIGDTWPLRHNLFKGLYDNKGSGKIWVYEIVSCDNCARSVSGYRFNINVKCLQKAHSELLGPEVEIMPAKYNDFGGFVYDDKQGGFTESEKRDMEIWGELKFPGFSKDLFRRDLQLVYRYVQSIAFWDDCNKWDEDNACYGYAPLFASFNSTEYEQWLSKLDSVDGLWGPYSIDFNNNDSVHQIKVCQGGTLDEKLSYYRIEPNPNNDGSVHVSSKLWEDFPAYVVISREVAKKEGRDISLYSEEEVRWAIEYKEKGFFPNHEVQDQGQFGSLLSTYRG